jgi:hypothetical protein
MLAVDGCQMNPDEHRIVGPLTLGALPVDLAHEAEPGGHRHLPDHPPRHKRSRIGPINPAAHIHVDRDGSQARTEDAAALKPCAPCTLHCRRKQWPRLHRHADPVFVLKDPLF